jgi:hypothetical protein
MAKPFVKDDVLPKLPDLKDARVKCSSRIELIHLDMLYLGLRGTEGKKKTMLRRSDCYNCTELSTLTTLISAPRCRAL